MSLEAGCLQKAGNARNARLELLFVVDNLKSGGAQKVLFSIVKSLDRSSTSPAVWCLGKGGPYADALRSIGVPVYRFRGLPLTLGAAAPWMMWYLRRRRPALMQSFLFHADNLARALGKLMGVPVVVASVRSEEISKPAWKRWIDRRTARRADLTIAVSDAALAHAVRYEGVSREKATVISNGIDVTEYDPAIRVAPGELGIRVPAGARIVGSVGRLGPEKSHRRLIEAFAEARARVPDAHLLLVGDGPMRAELAQLAQRLNIADAVHLIGFREDVPRLLAAMEIFCLPSLFEGMSNALLEAMAMGKACVATSVAGNRALIEDGVHGLLVSPGDVKAMSDALVALLRDPARARRLGAAARRRVEEEFTMKRMLEGYADAYTGMLSRKLGGQFAPTDLIRV